MPFKKNTERVLENTIEITNHTLNPINEKGLNESNLINYTPKTTITETEKHTRLQQVNISIESTQLNTDKTIKKRQNMSTETYGLIMPQPGTILKPTDDITELDEQIAKLVAIKIWDCVVYNKLYYFFTRCGKKEKDGNIEKTPQERLQDVVNRATLHDYQLLMELYNIPSVDQITDIAVLALFDVIELIDDSGSMQTTGYKNMLGNNCSVDFDQEEIDRINGIDHNTKSRWNLAELLVKLTSYTLTMFDDDGISIRFLNKRHQNLPSELCDNVSDPEKLTRLFKIVSPNGGTNIGASVKKIYEELVRDDLTSRTLSKPVLLVIYTDGESADQIKDKIRNIRADFYNSPYVAEVCCFLSIK